jgi:hypothetical protein
MNDLILGPLTKNVKLNGFDGSVSSRPEAITFTVVPDSDSLESTLAVARQFISQLHHYEALAKAKAAEFLLDECNGYRDSGHESPIERDDFISKLTLDSLVFRGATNVSVFFNDNDLFWGHTVIVECFDGQTFSHATLFG